MAFDFDAHPATPSGMEPELSSSISGDEPALGGDLREWPSIVAHLLSDQHEAQRQGDWARVQVIRRLRYRIWREADDVSWRRAQKGDSLTGGVTLSRWRRAEEIAGYQRPDYDTINDDIALTAMKLELAETQAALEQAQTVRRDDLVREHVEAMAIIESYIEWWEARIAH